MTGKPRVRTLDFHWIEHQGERYLHLLDKLGLRPEPAVVPWPVAIILSLCDGSRSEDEIRAGFELRAGMSIATTELRELLHRLDEELILEGDAFEQAIEAEAASFRAAPFRPPALAGNVYPRDPADLASCLAGYGAVTLDNPTIMRGDADAARGIVSPHIDYHRGGHVYAMTWAAAAPAIRAADLVVVFGTDHVGSAGSVTLTRQRYATPWGPLPNAPDVVDALARSIGENAAFAEELHHRAEHSVELAVVWLHYLRGQSPCPVLPILCGSFHRYTQHGFDADDDPTFQRLVDTLRAELSGQRVVYVAAADLAHVGPAFGDPCPLGEPEREVLGDADTALMQRVCAGDATGFLENVRAERDRRRICGLAPVYLLLRTLGDARGTVVGYDQCPADPASESFVSIGGILLW